MDSMALRVNLVLLFVSIVVVVAVVCLICSRQAHVGHTRHPAIRVMPYRSTSRIEPPTMKNLSTPLRRLTMKNISTPLKRHGYILSLDYSDQMTGSSMNLLSMQCWAKQSGMVVVEPFILRSMLGTCLDCDMGANYTRQPNAERLSDSFDIDVWQRYSREKGYSPLVSWEEFLNRSQRDVIIVSQPYHCECRISQFKDALSPLTSEFGFRIVRDVCFDFHEGVLTSELYSARLFGNYSSTDVTVIFNRWGGIEQGNNDKFRTAISDSTCNRFQGAVEIAATASKLIVSDVDHYISTYLSDSTAYCTVMIRFEYYFQHHNLNSLSQAKQSAAIDSCLQSIVSEWKMLQKRGLNNTLLTMDYGHHGSLGFVFGEVSWEEKMKRFFNDIYGSSLTVSQWEESFDAIARKKSPGYIAQMQRELAARGQCLLLAGSGGASSFQQQAKALYQRYHSGSTECISTACS